MVAILGHFVKSFAPPRKALDILREQRYSWRVPVEVELDPKDMSGTPEEREKEWLEKVYRGGTEPEITARGLILGLLIGAVLSLSNLYVGFKTGWSLGVTITAAIMSFALFKSLRKILPFFFKKDMGILELNILQTTASACAFIASAGLVSAVPALLMVSGKSLPNLHLILWVMAILYLGLFMAIPMKRQMINVEDLKFPTGFATSEVLMGMYAKGDDSIRKAKALFWSLGLGVVVAFLRDAHPLIMAKFNVLRGAVMPAWIKNLLLSPIPATFGPSSLPFFSIPLARLTLSFEGSFIMMGAGAIMGIRAGASLLLGALVGYGVLSPMAINSGDITHDPPRLVSELSVKKPGEAGALSFPLQIPSGAAFFFKTGACEGPRGDFREELLAFSPTEPLTIADEEGLLRFLNSEKLPDGSLNPIFGKVFFAVSAGKLTASASPLTHWDSFIESGEASGNALLGFPPGSRHQVNYGGFRNVVKWLMWPGVAMMVAAGLLSFFMQWKTVLRAFKGLSDLVKGVKGSSGDEASRVEIPASWFLIGFIAAGIGAVILQMMFFGISWWMGTIAVVMTFFLAIVACRATGETDITPVGAMGKITQLMYGAIAPGNMVANLMTANVTGGAATSSADLLQSLKCGYRIGASPRKQFLAMILGVIGGALICVPVYNILIPSADVIGTDKLPAPAAQTWAGVAILLSKGLSALPVSARWGLLWGAVFGIVITLIERNFPRSRSWLPSPTAMGIAFVIPAFNSVSMFLGALIAYILEKSRPVVAENYTVPVASGVIAGESIMGILVAMLIAFQVL